MNRRTLIAGFTGTFIHPALLLADDASIANDGSYVDYGYTDYFDNNTLGTEECPSKDIQKARKIVVDIQHNSPYMIMLHLRNLREKNDSGEPFNSRWKVYANPLIVFMFHEMHYYYSTYPDDEVPWCAAAMSWCLYWGGYQYPRHPSSSQSFLNDDRFTRINEEDLLPGDICVFTDTEDDRRGHVGFWCSDQKNVAPGLIRVLGGNQFHQGEGAVPTRASRVCFQDIPKNNERSSSFTKYLAGFVRPIDKIEGVDFSEDIKMFDLACGKPQN